MDLTLDIILKALTANIWLGLLAIWMYFLWKASPKIYDLCKEYLQDKKEEMTKIVEGIEKTNTRFGEMIEAHNNSFQKITEAIYTFEKALLGAESRIKESIFHMKEEIKEEIRDDKIRTEDRIRNLTKPKSKRAGIGVRDP